MNATSTALSALEAAWFRERGVLCLDLAAALHANSHSVDPMIQVLRAHRGKAVEASGSLLEAD